jgi:hypothetical protein
MVILAGLMLAGAVALVSAAPAEAAVVLYFPLHNYNSDKCLDVPNSSKVNGTHIQQWTCIINSNPSQPQIPPNQAWGFPNAARSGYVTAVNLNSGKCLDVTGRSTANGAVVQQWTCNGGTNQEWKPVLISGPPNVYRLVNLNSGKCLDVTGRSLANGAVIQQWTCNGGTNQEWFLTRGTI